MWSPLQGSRGLFGRPVVSSQALMMSFSTGIMVSLKLVRTGPLVPWNWPTRGMVDVSVIDGSTGSRVLFVSFMAWECKHDNEWSLDILDAFACTAALSLQTTLHPLQVPPNHHSPATSLGR